MSLTHYRTRAQYWMNDKVYAAGVPLLESPRKENRAPQSMVVAIPFIVLLLGFAGWLLFRMA
jgi:hypothetical protein